MRTTTRRAPALLAGLLLLAPLSARAADPDDDAPTQWTSPAAPPSPGAPGQGGGSEGDYAAPDRRRMDETRRKDVLDQLCRHLRLRRELSWGGDGRVPQLAVGVARRMEADFDGSLVLIDEETLRAGWTPLSDGTRLAGDASGAVWAGGTVSGKSIVVRRLGTFGTCGEVDRLIDLTDIKLALPTARRIQEMTKGELWRIPLAINVGYGASLSDALGTGASVTLGWSKAKNGAASMTLWRLSEKAARFRFRVDYVSVQSRSAGVSATFTPIEFATAGANVLSRFLKKEVAKQLHRYSSAYLGFSNAHSDGRRIVLEFVIDPTDAAQAEALAQALQGNLRTLLELARRVATSWTSPEETREAYDALAGDNRLHLGAPAYAARSEYGAHLKTFSLNLPFFVSRTVSEALGHDAVTRFTGELGDFTFHNAARSPSNEYFRAPFLGPLVKDLESRSLEVVAYAPGGKERGEPIAVYIDNHAFLRLPASSVASTVEDANSILRLAGAARRGEPDETMSLPGRRFLPPPQPIGSAAPGSLEQQEPSDQKGWTSFTLVMNQRAVRDALAASTQEALKAFALAAPLADRHHAQWLVANGRLEGDRLAYDPQKARAELNLDPGDSSEAWLARLSRQAAGLARDLADASAARSPEERSAALARAFSHESRSGLSHAEVLRVLVQFMDPLDLTGDFVSASDNTSRRGVRIGAHYVLKEGRQEVPLLRDAGETRARFAEGSVLTD